MEAPHSPPAQGTPQGAAQDAPQGAAHASEWAQLHEELRRFVRRRVPSDAMAEDIVQDAFLRAQQQAQAGHQVDNPRAWLFRVVRHLVSDAFRSDQRERSLADRVDGAPELDDALSPDALQEEVFPLVAQVLPLFIDALDAPYREAVRWVDLEGMTQAQAAERTSVSLTCMKARVRRGRAQLLAALQGCCAFEVDARGKVIDWQRRQTGSCACSG